MSQRGVKEEKDVTQKYVCDAMLGKLARWLRLLGYDVDYPTSNYSDNQLLEYAINTERVLITRDTRLANKAEKVKTQVVYIQKTEVQSQLEEFAEHVSPIEPLQLEGTRCSLCNTLLISTNADFIREIQAKLQNEVHEKTLKHYEEFWYCPNCFQAYWKGRQWERISETLKKINNSRTS